VSALAADPAFVCQHCGRPGVAGEHANCARVAELAAEVTRLAVRLAELERCLTVAVDPAEVALHLRRLELEAARDPAAQARSYVARMRAPKEPV